MSNILNAKEIVFKEALKE